MRVEDDEYTARRADSIATIFSTMLEFYPDDASMWAGPFQEKYAFLSIEEAGLWGLPLKTLADIREEEERVLAAKKRKFANAGKRIRKQLESYRFHWHEHQASLEKSIRVYVCGNDDVSYSKFFETVEEAKEFVNTLIACQPLTRRDITDEFVFTP